MISTQGGGVAVGELDVVVSPHRPKKFPWYKVSDTQVRSCKAPSRDYLRSYSLTFQKYQTG